MLKKSPRMNFKIALLATSLIFLIGCETRKNEAPLTVASIKVPVPPNGAILMLSEVIENISYLKLQERPNHLVGNIDKIICYKDRFYILDRDATKSLFAFEMNGNFLFQIDKQGPGPGQYIRPDDFIIDAFDNKIVLLDSNQRKLLFFDSDGHYRGEETLPFSACSLAKLGANSFAFYLSFIPYEYRNNHYNVFVIQNGSIKKTFFRFIPSLHRLRLTPQTVFSSNTATTFIAPTFNDTVFEITSSRIIPKYFIDFGDTQLPKNFFGDHQKMTVDALRQEINKFSHLIQNFCETSNHISFNFSYQHKSFVVFYSKVSHTIKVGGLVGNDVDGGCFSYPIASCGNELIGVMEPTDLIDIYQKNSFRVSTKLASVANDLSELSNPVIALYKLKNF